MPLGGDLALPAAGRQSSLTRPNGCNGCSSEDRKRTSRPLSGKIFRRALGTAASISAEQTDLMRWQLELPSPMVAQSAARRRKAPTPKLRQAALLTPGRVHAEQTAKVTAKIGEISPGNYGLFGARPGESLCPSCGPVCERRNGAGRSGAPEMAGRPSAALKSCPRNSRRIAISARALQR